MSLTIAKKRRHRHDERTFKDPVCGMTVSPSGATETIEYAGRAYYFCAPACREAFEADPERYAKHHRQHGVKPE